MERQSRLTPIVDSGARFVMSGVRWGYSFADRCAQQAAERAIKTILVVDQTVFRRTHALLVLAALVNETTRHALADVDLLALQPWAVDGRYPGDLPDATAGEVTEAVSIARLPIRIAREQLAQPIRPSASLSVCRRFYSFTPAVSVQRSMIAYRCQRRHRRS